MPTLRLSAGLSDPMRSRRMYPAVSEIRRRSPAIAVERTRREGLTIAWAAAALTRTTRKVIPWTPATAASWATSRIAVLGVAQERPGEPAEHPGLHPVQQRPQAGREPRPPGGGARQTPAGQQEKGRIGRQVEDEEGRGQPGEGRTESAVELQGLGHPVDASGAGDETAGEAGQGGLPDGRQGRARPASEHQKEARDQAAPGDPALIGLGQGQAVEQAAAGANEDADAGGH